MKRPWLVCLPMAALVLAGRWAMSQPEPPPMPPGGLGMPLVSLEMQKVTLRQALEALAKQAPALNFVVRDDFLDGEKTLTVRLRNVPADQALMALLRGAGCYVEPISAPIAPPGAILVVSPEGPRPIGMVGGIMTPPAPPPFVGTPVAPFIRVFPPALLNEVEPKEQRVPPGK